MEVFLEEVFVSNFIMNLVILLQVKHVLVHNASNKHLAIASLIASVAGILFLLLQAPALALFACKTLFASAIVCIAFPVTNAKQFVVYLFSFLLCTALYGGIGYAVFQNLNQVPTLVNSALLRHSYILAAIYVVTITCYLLIKNLVGLFKQRLAKAAYQYNVTLYNDSYCAKVSGYLDSGNCLTDPNTNKPIIIISEQVFSKLFGMQALLYFYSKQYDKINLMHPHWINSCGVGVQSKMLVFTLSGAEICHDNAVKQVIHPVVGLTCSSLSELGCGCILSPVMLIS